MFLKYRNRTFMGAFHNNPDYMWWYGYAPMQNSLLSIKDEAEILQAGGGTAGPEGPAGAAGEDAPMWILWTALTAASIALIISLYLILMRQKS